MTLRRALRILRPLGFAAGAALLVVTAVAAMRDLNLRGVDPPWLVVALAAALAWWLALVASWSVLAAGRWHGGQATLWVRTQALRYLPGGIWAPASRAVLAPGAPVERITLVTAENVVALCAALAIGGAAFALAGEWAWAPLLLALAVPLVAAHAVPHRVEPRRARRALGWTLAGFAAYGACAAAVQAGLPGPPQGLATAGAAAIAWAAGLVVVIAPSGLGVREAVFVALMRGRISSGDAATAALLLRAVTIVAEALTFAALAGPNRWRVARPSGIRAESMPGNPGRPG